MSLNQREENTPSPVSKEDGSNKRILINQGNPTSKPLQPPAIMDPPVNTPHVAMEINVTTSGQDGNESINSNPNNNPNPTIPLTHNIVYNKSLATVARLALHKHCYESPWQPLLRKLLATVIREALGNHC